MKREDVFERLSPPPGGLADLRERMGLRAIPLRRYLPAGVALATAAAAIVVVQSRPAPPDLIARAHARGDAAEMVLGLAPPQRDPVVLADDDRATTALERVPTSRPDVAFYWVASTQASPLR